MPVHPDGVVYRAGVEGAGSAPDADPITTEVIRHGLNSAANQIKRSLIRASFSPIIYEVLDFAAVVYDRKFRLLAQAPSLPFFMGTMSFCIESAVEAVGGESELFPGDIILMNDPYKTGSHPQDAAVVMPVFMPDGTTLIGYTAIKAHWLDIGAKELYCTDTTDVFQEGTIFPGVKLYSKGELVRDIWRMALANSRLATFVEGDINAEVAGCRTGAAAFVRLVERYGVERFEESVERMFDHGEAVVRSYLEQIPDGRYVGKGVMDSDGITDDEIPFEVVLEVKGSTVLLDFSSAPDARPGPVNCPIASTVSAARVVMTMLAGGGEAPNEGHFRPVEIATRPGSMFHCLSPSPCFLYGWPAMQATEAVLNAVAEAVPDRVVACSGGDLAAVVWWGVREATGEFWGDGSPHPVGQGASSRGDGASSCLHHIEAATRFSPMEVWEAKNPWLIERFELATDSGGPGKHRGGLGPDMHFLMLEDTYCTSTIERTKNAPWGLAGGLPGRPNSGRLVFPDGTERPVAKETGLHVPKGATFEIHAGGGGGYGDPAERDPEAVLADVREGYVSEAEARKHYPHAFGG
ncbi:MAG: hydantoinase B/oxoprolinase family protein [Thermoleophilia bacterium]